MEDEDINLKIAAEFYGFIEDEPWLNGERCFTDGKIALKLEHMPDYMFELNWIQQAIQLKLNDNLKDRVRFLNILRDVIARRPDIQRNSVGTPLVSDYNVLTSTAPELCEALLRTYKLWEEPKQITT